MRIVTKLQIWSSGDIFLNIMKRTTQKLRKFILLHFWISNFSDSFWETSKCHQFHVSRTWWTCPWLRKPILFIFGNTKIPQIFQETNRSILETYCVWESQNFEHRPFWKCWKRRGRTIPKIRLTNSWESWIWDQYLLENMLWAFCKMGTMSSKKHQMICESSNLWDFENLKLRNFESLELWDFEIWNLETLKLPFFVFN